MHSCAESFLRDASLNIFVCPCSFLSYIWKIHIIAQTKKCIIWIRSICVNKRNACTRRNYFFQARTHSRNNPSSQIFINLIETPLITIKCSYCINQLNVRKVNFLSYVAFVCHAITIAIKIRVEIEKIIYDKEIHDKFHNMNIIDCTV